MAFSCHILLSMVHPGCAMLWRSPNMNFPCHQRVRKLLGLMALVNGATRHNLLYTDLKLLNCKICLFYRLATSDYTDLQLFQLLELLIIQTYNC